MGVHLGRGEVVRTVGDHWFEPVAQHMGRAYLRYSFAQGTVQEIDFLIGALDLTHGMRVLDVGCGPGRHSHELARRGILVHGIDISQEFIDIAQQDAPPGATFERLDARALLESTHLGEFDAVICLCQGAFGLMTANGDDESVVAGMAHSLKIGGRAAISAFNAYFSVKYHEEAVFDASTGVSHEVTKVRNLLGEEIQVDLWTGCYTPRELRLLMTKHRLDVDSVFSVEPGAYGQNPPSVESAEFLVLGTRC